MKNLETINILLIKNVLCHANDITNYFNDDILYHLQCVSSLKETLDCLHSKNFDIAIIDLDLPDCNGLEGIKKIRKEFPLLALIVLASLKDEELALSSIDCGVDQYLIKEEFNKEQLKRLINSTLARKKYLNKLEINSKIHLNSNFNFNYIDKVKSFPTTDSLTSLPNKLTFESKIVSMIDGKANSFAVLIVDIDKFNSVNDLYGHNVGDLLLISISQWIKKKLNIDDFLARFGSDQFGIITSLQNLSDYGIFARELNKINKNPFIISGINLRVSLSIGIAVYIDNGLTAAELLKNADIALFNAKKSGRNIYQYYKKDIDDKRKRLLSIENKLHFAIAQNEFKLLFQPIVELKARKVVGFEALLRWRSPVLGYVEPDVFIKIAESSSVITDITQWVIENTLASLSLWNKHYPIDFTVSINISAVDLIQTDLVNIIIKNLKKFKLPTKILHVELTETAIMHDANVADKNLISISKAGIKISIDDFGTGYSSLNRIKSLPVDIIKIDKSFVTDLLHYDIDCQVIRSMISLAKSLHLITIAEGIESEEVASYLQELGCDYGQGYYFSKPLTIDEAIIYYKTSLKNSHKF